MAAKVQDIDFLECEIDDISLSQICVAMENDQVEWDNSIDDASLSQIGFLMENEAEMMDEMDILTISQAMEKYDVLDAASIGSFDLTQDQLSVENVIEQLEDLNPEFEKINVKTVSASSESRYGNFVADTDIKNLIKSTESRNTRKNTNWSLTTFNDWRFARMNATGSVIPDIKELIKG